jgi:hypothetical protein
VTCFFFFYFFFAIYYCCCRCCLITIWQVIMSVAQQAGCDAVQLAPLKAILRVFEKVNEVNCDHHSHYYSRPANITHILAPRFILTPL